MAQVILSLVVLFLTIFSHATAVKPAVLRRSRARAFVESQCQMTLYPKLCVQCLSSQVNTALPSAQQLAQAALTVSLARAWVTRAYVIAVAKQLKQTKYRHFQAVKDCLHEINDSVDQITQSIKELRQMGQEDGEDQFIWHESNVQTWVSAALTDATTCIDGFSGHAMGGKVKATIKAKMLNVAQVTSNALALFNRFTARHRASRAKKP